MVFDGDIGRLEEKTKAKTRRMKMIGWFSKYRKVPEVIRESIKAVDNSLTAYDKGLVREARKRKDLGRNKKHVVSRLRKGVQQDARLRKYMCACGVDIEDFYDMLYICYWMFLCDGGFDIYDMEDELSYYDEFGLEGYGMETIEDVVVDDNPVTVEEAATINEPVLEPVERGEEPMDIETLGQRQPDPVIEHTPEPAPVVEEPTRTSFADSSPSYDSGDSGGYDSGGDCGGCD
jgi:hypothetical protein